MFNQLLDPSTLFVAASVVLILTIFFFAQAKKRGGVVQGLRSMTGLKGKTPQGADILGQYSTNYTTLAREKKLDPVIGRQREVDRLVQVLSRKTKNNALLLGEPGVGKTAVVERLALMIVEGNVPDSIAGKDIISLDLASLVSGTKYRGELEMRLDALRKEFTNASGDIILFIDEIQQLAQASGSEGGLNPGDILKPELARGSLQIIGATTYDDYEKYIVPEESLERRFQPVHVHEPTREETLEILRGVQAVFGKFHGVSYTKEALVAIVDLTKMYIKERYLPDKAIDVLDEAGVRARLNHLKAKHKHDGLKEKPVTVDVDTIKEVISDWVEIPVKKLL